MGAPERWSSRSLRVQAPDLSSVGWTSSTHPIRPWEETKFVSREHGKRRPRGKPRALLSLATRGGCQTQGPSRSLVLEKSEENATAWCLLVARARSAVSARGT